MRKLDRYEFIWKAIQKHGYKYDYTYTNYINNKTMINIVCPIHGMFKQQPVHHLNGNGCQVCKNIKLAFYNQQRTNDTNGFICSSCNVHGFIYDYSKVSYINNRTPVIIICPKHGEFNQTPKSHLNGHGCPKCSNKLKSTNLEFIDKATKIHGNIYDYSHSNYVNNHSKINIICKKHGEFFQKPNDHLNGHGCPMCNESKLEKSVKKILLCNNIKFQYQKKFKWLGNLSLDYYLPKYNLAIECQGVQHFKPIAHFGGETMFKKLIDRDHHKNELCLKHGIQILYYTKYKTHINEYMGLLYTDLSTLIKHILSQHCSE